jgi:hypothetical protein
MAYINQEDKAKLSPAIKAVLKKYSIKGSIAISNYSTLVVNIKSGKIDFIKNANDSAAKREHPGMPILRAKGHIDVNPYHYQTQFTGKALQFLKELEVAMKGNDWFDDSDSMTDYFHTAYYIGINIGNWDKDYVVA